jgi:hypothetical protein
MGGVPVGTVAQMVEIAQNVEIDLNLEKAARPPGDVKGKGKMHSGSSKWRKRKAGGGTSEGTQATLSGEGQPRKQMRNVECYHCHEMGHIRSRCPYRRQPGQGQLAQPVQTVQPAPQGQIQMPHRPALPAPPVQSQSQQTSRGQQRVQGRAYALTTDEAAASATAITGTLSVCGLPAFALVDSGSTHSIVSADFARCMGNVCRSFDCEYVIATPVGIDLYSHQCLIGCDVSVGDQCLPADLIVLGITDFDVVLGMDWLEQNYANIDCRSKMVTFAIPGLPRFCFYGDRNGRDIPMISALHACRLMQQGCEGYLAYLLNPSGSASSLGDIPVVSEYPDVFPEELPGLPPEREIDFSIELVPGTAFPVIPGLSLPPRSCNGSAIASSWPCPSMPVTPKPSGN